MIYLKLFTLIKSLLKIRSHFFSSTIFFSLLIFAQIPTLNNRTSIKKENYTNFSDWCLNYSEITKENQITVKALIEISLANTQNLKWNEVIETDKCFSLEKKILNKKSLDLSEREYYISSLTPIASLKNLEELNLEKQLISDLSPLSSLNRLEKLNLSRNRINNLAPLSSVASLKELNLSYNLIHFLEPLSSLVKLEKLTIERSVISDIKPLNSLANLKYLNLGYNRINDIEPLVSLYNLKKLDLNHNLITSISPITPLTNLVELEIKDNYIPLEAQICPYDRVIICRNLYDQRLASDIEQINIFQRQEEILKNFGIILKQRRNGVRVE